MIYKVDTNHLKELVNKSGEFIATPEAEQALTDLFINIPAEINKAQEQVKSILTEQSGGSALTIATDTLKVRLSSKKGQYKWVDDPVNDYTKEVKSVRVDADKVREYLEANGSLPEGITQAEEATTLAVKGVE